MRSVGIQQPTIKRPCYLCSRGLKGKPYCYNCGNTKDGGGGRPSSEEGRTPAETTIALRSSVRLVAGLEYIVSIMVSNDVEKTIQGVCEWSAGPFARVGKYDINILEIKEIRLCDS